MSSKALQIIQHFQLLGCVGHEHWTVIHHRRACWTSAGNCPRSGFSHDGTIFVERYLILKHAVAQVSIICSMGVIRGWFWQPRSPVLSRAN